MEVHQKPVYSEDGSAFLLLAAVQEGGGQYFTHIKHVDVLRQRIAVLSHGKVEVAEILAWDQENNLVYYLGTLKIVHFAHVAFHLVIQIQTFTILYFNYNVSYFQI